jgi:diguanylate cyclase (GGDEF)-like protein
MKKRRISEDLLSMGNDEIVPYDNLTQFADHPALLDLFIQKYGNQFYKRCIFSLTHISVSEKLAEKKWEDIVTHRIYLNGLLHRDVGLKVAAIDYLENVSFTKYSMTSFETSKADDIARVATTDKLTGLYMRDIFHEMLEKEFQLFLRNGRPLALLMIDIDNFKNYNDTYGHQAGDKVLIKIGKTLLHTVRKSDIGCRYGGEELVVIMPQTDLNTALEVAERIRKKIEDTDIDGENITVSIGVSQANSSIKMSKTLLKFADDALYQAKRQGKNKIVVA